GDESTRAHALVNVGTAMLQLDPDAGGKLLEAHAVADAAGDRHEGSRSLVNLGYSSMLWLRTEEALRYAQQALDYAREHEVDTLASYAASTVAWLRLRKGEWAEAELAIRAEVERNVAVFQPLANTVRTELAVRRGDPEAAELLAELVA